ncbi:hypothetical protein WJX73_005357 [Symbiochloris irregularis]|uniref:C2HC/C3H-type domain-containing protein n=1 Tax=Symbiochloris irregularis TaxID=706552 RepID=A0AAW1PA84_9CHLO
MYAAAAAAAPRENPENLVTCQGCERSFIPEAYERHARICAKVFQTKRRAFDAAAARAPEEMSDGTFGKPAPLPGRGRTSVGGGPGAKAGAKAGGAKAAGGKAAQQAKWKAQSAQLRAAMAAAKGPAAAGDPTAFAAPVVDDSLTPCPHCGRRFNDKAAERHIPLCKDIRAKPTTLKAGGGRGAGAFAKR